MKRALHDARQILRAVDAIHALAEWAVDLELIRILMQVHFLMRVTAVVVRRDVAGNDHHRNRVERGIRHSRCGVREPGTQMSQQHARFSRRAGVSVRGVRGHLLVAAGDEANAALADGVQKRDVRVTAQTENDLDAEPLEILGEQV